MVYLIRRIIVILQWKLQKDPRTKQARVNCFFCMFVNTFEVAWFVYGNYLFFHEEESDFRQNDHLKETLLAIVIWGYIVMFVYAISICGIVILLYGMYQYGIFDSEKQKEYQQLVVEKETKKITIGEDNQKRITKRVKN